MKKATFKKLSKLTHCESIYWDSIERGQFGEGATRYCVSDSLADYVDCYDGWYAGRIDSDWKYMGDDAIAALNRECIDTYFVNEESEFFDSELLDMLQSDLTRATTDAERDEWYCDLEKALEQKIYQIIEESNCDYWAFTKTDKQGQKKECEFYESDSITLGFTAKNPELEDWQRGWACIDKFHLCDLLDSRYSPWADTKQIMGRLLDYAEYPHEVEKRKALTDSIKAEYCFESTLQGV